MYGNNALYTIAKMTPPQAPLRPGFTKNRKDRVPYPGQAGGLALVRFPWPLHDFAGK